jgi:hypothetical protein
MPRFSLTGLVQIIVCAAAGTIHEQVGSEMSCLHARPAVPAKGIAPSLYK